MNSKLEKENLEKVIESEDMVLLYFGNEKCSVCRDLKPKIDKIMDKYNKIEYIHIDVETNLKLSRDYNIFTIPAILLYIEGKEVIREARFLSVYELEDKISRYYSLFFER